MEMAELQPTESRRLRVLSARCLPTGFYVVERDEVIIGRDRQCQIVLLADEMSRRHARLAKDGPFTYTVADLRSRNGTFVNGELLKKPRRLDHDDVITVGPFRLRYQVVEETRNELARRFSSALDESHPDGERPEQAGAAQMSGKFSGTTLAEVCHLIELNRHSGKLRVEAGGLLGRLEFRAGKIVDARFGSFAGEKAARSIMGLASGKYAFEAPAPGAKLPTGPLALSPGALALDIARIQDETRETRIVNVPKGFFDKPLRPPGGP